MKDPVRCLKIILLAAPGAALLLLWAAMTGPAAAVPGDRSPDGLWAETPAKRLAAGASTKPLPEGYRAFRLDAGPLRSILRTAPPEFTTSEPLVVIELPMPDGRFRPFAVESSPMLAPRVQAQYPDLATYRIWSTEDPTERGRASLHGLRFHAVIRTADGLVRIEHIRVDGDSRYASYLDEQGVPEHPGFCGFDVQPTSAPNPAPGPGASVSRPAGGGQAELWQAGPPSGGTPASPATEGPVSLRSYDIALATTPGYTAQVVGAGETVIQVITELFDLVNTIWEDELAVRMTLVSGEELFFNNTTNRPPAGCPAMGDNTDACVLRAASQCAINNRIGSANYDVGHLLARYNVPPGGSSGCAQFPGLGICQSAKGGSVSKHFTPANPYPYIVLHELGHMLGASHSMAGSGCGGAFAQGACEPGSGSTIMSYAGFCGSDSVQPGPDLYYHSCSADQIDYWLTFSGICGGHLATGNNPPEVDRLPSFNLPKNTAFTLTGAGSDPDSGDTIRYSWEQVDPAQQSSSPLTDSGDGDPIFRSEPPDLDSTHVYEAQGVPGEILPTTDRTIHMRLSARDQNPNGGVGTADLVITVEGAPFLVTSPTDTTTVTSTSLSVQWDPGGTAGDVPYVNIFLSRNGGQTYELLLDYTPNDGSEVVAFDPCPSTFDAVIKVEGAIEVADPVPGVTYTVFDLSREFKVFCPCPPTASCGGCPFSNCISSDTGHENCWDVQQGLLWCQPGETIQFTQCDCAAPVGQGQGGYVHPALGCGQEKRVWNCNIVPDCPTVTPCTPCGQAGTCDNCDTGLGACRLPDQTLLDCVSHGGTVHIKNCTCGIGGAGSECPDTGDKLVCLLPGVEPTCP